MAKTILVVHGRDLKPPKEPLENLWIEALRFGIERDRPSKLPACDAAVKELVYYGDVSNTFLGKPGFDDSLGRRGTLEQLKRYKTKQFTKQNYEKLPGKSAWEESPEDAIAGVASLLRINDPIIGAVAPDIREYWNPHSQFSSDVRYPMIAPLKAAMDGNDEILVVSHSLGTMIAYDTFRKFCRFGEYRPHRGEDPSLDYTRP